MIALCSSCARPPRRVVHPPLRPPPRAPGAAVAQVTRLEILSREPAAGSQVLGAAGAYETLQRPGPRRGRPDRPAQPRSSRTSTLAPRNARGRVEYVATFSLMKPVDASAPAACSMYTVVNRGNGAPSAGPEGHVSLVSGWQGDVAPTADNQTITVPIAKARGRQGHHRSGAGTVLRPACGDDHRRDPPGLARHRLLSARHARSVACHARVSHASETVTRRDRAAPAPCRRPTGRSPIAARRRFPGRRTRRGSACTADSIRPRSTSWSTRRRIRWSSASAWPRRATSCRSSATRAADARHAEPGRRTWFDTRSRIGTSQSGNFLKTFVHLGFNEDLVGPHRLGRRVAAHRGASDADQLPVRARRAAPRRSTSPAASRCSGGAATRTRRAGVAPASLLDRCTATRTCPKVFEAFGSAEFWGLRMSPGLVGTDAVADIPLPDNVRRYYMPGTTHGGGQGGFQLAQPGRRGARCRRTRTRWPTRSRALTAALVAWVVKGTPPPASRYPTLADRMLVPATRAATAFPRFPASRFPTASSTPCSTTTSVRTSSRTTCPGVITRQPPGIRKVLPTLCRASTQDGNEIAGVASVLHQAPLGYVSGLEPAGGGLLQGAAVRLRGRVRAVRGHRRRTAEERRPETVARRAIRHARRLRVRRVRAPPTRSCAIDSCCPRPASA